MSFQEYNYYGSYEEDSRKFTYSLEDIHRKQKEKNKRRLRIYESILSKIYKKIKQHSILEEHYCFYQLPEYIPGYPLYNMTECVLFVIQSLSDQGYKARYVDPFIIFVTWNIPKPELRRMIQRPQIENKSNYEPTMNSSQPSYPSIENQSQSSSSFFYKRR